MSDEQKKAAKLSRADFNLITREYLCMDRASLAKEANKKELTAMQAIILSILNQALETGDAKIMNWILEQIFGRIKNISDINLSGTIETTRSIDYSKLSTDELAFLKKIAEKNEAEK